jgi:hypothetical protein
VPCTPVGLPDRAVPPIGDVMIEAEGVSCDVHRRPRFLEDRRLLVCLPRGD